MMHENLMGFGLISASTSIIYHEIFVIAESWENRCRVIGLTFQTKNGLDHFPSIPKDRSKNDPFSTTALNFCLKRLQALQLHQGPRSPRPIQLPQPDQACAACAPPGLHDDPWRKEDHTSHRRFEWFGAEHLKNVDYSPGIYPIGFALEFL